MGSGASKMRDNPEARKAANHAGRYAKGYAKANGPQLAMELSKKAEKSDRPAIKVAGKVGKTVIEQRSKAKGGYAKRRR
ncbi:hypothetical protein LTR37_004951 [Vermiconidia calcicola]|uniref:Uncharacterized protein n=1 Tax=Vermiconidia calcicola TaxID=1690605 RepID=A0ACC3NKQ1_9PEZI|nr:hypothetical protein LTR37_004951 [Vermiconidia calcicola]